MHIDNAYKVSNFKFRLRCCKTNLAPPTSCRAFGSETAIVIETIMHNMASKLKVPSVQVSSLSFLPLEKPNPATVIQRKSGDQIYIRTN